MNSDFDYKPLLLVPLLALIALPLTGSEIGRAHV